MGVVNFMFVVDYVLRFFVNFVSKDFGYVWEFGVMFVVVVVYVCFELV